MQIKKLFIALGIVLPLHMQGANMRHEICTQKKEGLLKKKKSE